MVNDLKQLLRDNVSDAPADQLDVAALVDAGRRRVRGRRTALVGGAAVLVTATIAAATLGLPSTSDHADPAGAPPKPDAPTIQLSGAQTAVVGRDYRVLASQTNRDLVQDNGQYFDGVTDDGLILFRDGPRSDQPSPRYALLDPATGDKDWLPALDIGWTQTAPVELGADRLVLLAVGGSDTATQTAYVFDRAARQWSTMSWPGLPQTELAGAVAGPGGRLYFFVPATRGKVPEGGWPTGNGGEADDSNADGDTFHLWSASPTDSADVRDEDLVVGDLAFTDDSMVWTDSTNGHAGDVHVRDLATGAERSFDPHLGARCNLLSFGATGDRIMMSQYCGDYAGDVRDDRVQILTTAGEQVVTIQESGVEGWLPPGNDLVVVSSYAEDHAGTYLYDLTTNRLLRVSNRYASWSSSGPVGEARQFLWSTPVNHRHGATQHLGEILD